MKSTQKFEIKTTDGNVLFSCESDSLAHAVELAVKNHTDLCGADLSKADLREADLGGADLCGADLREADLREANLCGADLCGANLREAGLRKADLCKAVLGGADLCGADLCGAKLYGANLRGTNLSEADLHGAELYGANLRGANLDFACWPLWCGSFGVRVDAKIVCQLAYHFCKLDCDDPECKQAQAALATLANKFHRVAECGKIKIDNGGQS